MKTVVIWDDCQANLQFFILDGDYTRFHLRYVNSLNISNEESDELSNLVYADTGKELVKMFHTFPVEAVREGAQVIVCGFLP